MLQADARVQIRAVGHLPGLSGVKNDPLNRQHVDQKPRWFYMVFTCVPNQSFSNSRNLRCVEYGEGKPDRSMGCYGMPPWPWPQRECHPPCPPDTWSSAGAIYGPKITLITSDKLLIVTLIFMTFMGCCCPVFFEIIPAIVPFRDSSPSQIKESSSFAGQMQKIFIEPFGQAIFDPSDILQGPWSSLFASCL